MFGHGTVIRPLEGKRTHNYSNLTKGRVTGVIKIMVRVCHHINSQNTACKSNYNNHCNTPQYFPTTTRRTQKRKTGELITVRRGVCMKSDNQRKGRVK